MKKVSEVSGSVREVSGKIQAARAWSVEALKKLGFRVLPSKANFIFAKHPLLDGGVLYTKLKERGILVRHFEKPRIREYNRITVGSEEQMTILIQTIQSILEERK